MLVYEEYLNAGVSIYILHITIFTFATFHISIYSEFFLRMYFGGVFFPCHCSLLTVLSLPFENYYQGVALTHSSIDYTVFNNFI